MKLPDFGKYYTTPDSLRYGKFSLTDLLLEEPNLVPYGTPPIQMFIKCDGKYFRDMFVAVADPNNHYVTYANEEIEQHALYRHSVLPLDKVAVILKNSKYDRPWCISDATHLLSNLFGLPTAYSRSLKINNETLTLTVDYVKYGEYFFTLKDFFSYKDNLSTNKLRIALNKIKNDIRDLQRETKIPVEYRKKLAKEFVPIYLFRKYIISDGDFTGDKLGVIYNMKNREYSWAPCYDMECAFTNLIKVLPMLEEDILFMIEHYPKRMNNIINNYEKILLENNIYSTLKNNLSEKDAFMFAKLIEHRLALIINIYNYFCKK